MKARIRKIVTFVEETQGNGQAGEPRNATRGGRGGH